MSKHYSTSACTLVAWCRMHSLAANKTTAVNHYLRLFSVSLAPNVSQLLQLCLNCSKCVSIAPNVSHLLQMCLTCSKCVSLASNVSQLLQMSHLLQMCLTCSKCVSIPPATITVDFLHLQVAVTVSGVTYGAILGLFSLGMFFPWANTKVKRYVRTDTQKNLRC